ncbi:exodeoxyribonuclease V subunit gamma [Litorivicinus lipolyticus]|uniref:exodeoxyribonuclease V subunit gamma n=1 Tax=Litorivicinus lipolyticus TaxID=418701 RepID=UPI003B5A88A3
MTENALTPGLLFVRSNRNEQLRALTIDWMRRYPLGVFETETLLVHSNGIAQWFQRAMAQSADEGGLGIAAAVDISLPARFIWPTYRSVLGDLPAKSSFDKSVLTWRLYADLPRWADDGLLVGLGEFFERQGDPIQRYQLASMVADLFDQYQLYRPDWLRQWEAGHDQITRAGMACDVDAANRWQPVLWRLLKAQYGAQLDSDRAQVHQQFIQACATLTSRPPGLAQRVVVFGLASMPVQLMEVLAAIARFTQVIICVHSPSPSYWSDQWQGSLDADVHPLLDAWGQLGRDNARMLDDFQARPLMSGANAEVDLYSSPGAASLLKRVQSSLYALDSTPALGPADASVRAVSCHSAQREVEVLQDHLLALFDGDSSLRPDQVLVMVPAIDDYASHIRAVFGRLSSVDARFLPTAVSDQSGRSQSPWLRGLLDILELTSTRFEVADLMRLLGVAPIRATFGIDETELATIDAWLRSAQVRWGLNATQQNDVSTAIDGRYSWAWGVQRLLLGYAAGDLAWQGIDGVDSVSGLGAQTAGRLARFVSRAERLWSSLQGHHPSSHWIAAFRALQTDWLVAEDAVDLGARRQADSALDSWAADLACADADPVIEAALAVAVWTRLLEQAASSSQFLHDAIQFATLMPMRAIPYRHICILGLNDHAYPRPNMAVGPDLMQHDYRPGDRARREDDRYLFLEAILSARDGLYLSYQGRSPVDNAERAPSVLWDQWFGFLAAGGAKVELEQHPVHPYSSDYFIQDSGLATYAREWAPVEASAASPDSDEVVANAPVQWTLRDIGDVLKSPSTSFLRRRYDARCQGSPQQSATDEAFRLAELDGWQVTDAVIRAAQVRIDAGEAAEPALARAIATVARQGRLGVDPFQSRVAQALIEQWTPALNDYRQRLLDTPQVESLSGQLQATQGTLNWHELTVRCGQSGRVRLGLHASRARVGSGNRVGLNYLAQAWVEHLACQLTGPTDSHWWFKDGRIDLAPCAPEDARATLLGLLEWAGRAARRPLPCDPSFAAEVIATEGWSDKATSQYLIAVKRSEDLLRCWADAEALADAPELVPAALALYGGLLEALGQ